MSIAISKTIAFSKSNSNITESRALVARAHAAIINASIHQAIRGDAAHTKMLLTMAGSYTDKITFPNKQGEPQSITPQVMPYSELERANRLANYFMLAVKRKREFEAQQKQKEEAKVEEAKNC